MRIRSIAVFAVGYYLGARAGRHRYEQMNRLLNRAVDSDAGGRARAMVDLGVERARDLFNLPSSDTPTTGTTGTTRTTPMAVPHVDE